MYIMIGCFEQLKITQLAINSFILPVYFSVFIIKVNHELQNIQPVKLSKNHPQKLEQNTQRRI